MPAANSDSKKVLCVIRSGCSVQNPGKDGKARKSRGTAQHSNWWNNYSAMSRTILQPAFGGSVLRDNG